MSYKKSPRPTFTEATEIPYQSVTRFLWGDEATGFVDDYIYASTDKIHQLVFGLPPHGAFRHSKDRPTVFGADEVLYVLSGTYGSANPETGEVHVAKKGEAIFFRKDTWHHGFSLSDEPLQVLEYFAPPPSTGTSNPYAKSRPYVENSIYQRKELIGDWPMASARAQEKATMRVIREADLLWELDGADQGVLTGLFASTDQLTVGRTTVMSGRPSLPQKHGGDECLYVTSGVLRVHVPENEGRTWFELHPGDGFFTPAGTAHQYWNMGGEPAVFVFGVAPHYLQRQ
ncbi:cupin domain-containing protein [Mesorhizobium comanense]|uniref:cupin domain-containing protein n=1 Tax=Mesorhizobium comanense TaxID=2502215 RepID=UPI0014856BE3|nr:cupin domain-containing protein [Mesorhizobium comanense]